MPTSTISYLWRDPGAARTYQTGVSLHSHTNQSQETLDFVADWGCQYKLIRPLLNRLEQRSHNNHGIPINWARSYWTPPLTPKLAFDLESRQIEKLNVAALVSVSDHDNIQAPLLLRSVPSARHIPISVEWTAPYAGEQNSKQYFHLGIHNLPSARASEWMETLAEFTAHPNDARLTELLVALNQEPNVLVIFNHPLWDLYRIGQDKHEFLVNEFLQKNGAHFHALELNGLRDWAENRAVRRLAERWNMLLISGGDRHGVEPNANINLTNATSFNEFVYEVRKERRSSVLFMPQYAEPWKHRILQSTMDAIRNYPEFPQGSRTWDQRVYHPDANGVIRPLSEIWPSGRPPRTLSTLLTMVRMMGTGPFSSSLRYAWSDSSQLRFELGDQEAY
ncbi:hypothetical protein [Acidicapsa acidisoli]|uniref:hypothetical protein n=1 Tax=Acidicapsa acidisoli TaxID=1615681 RepID=UPI0021DFCFCB|nr:hypothetical protein [Acidicapsa acidisoli]